LEKLVSTQRDFILAWAMAFITRRTGGWIDSDLEEANQMTDEILDRLPQWNALAGIGEDAE
jgi:hypothetical protein